MKREKEKVIIQDYLFEDKIRLMKEMIGLELFQVLSLNETRYTSTCHAGKFTSYQFGDSVKLFLRSEKRSQLWDLHVKFYPDTLYGDLHGLHLACRNISQDTIIYQNLEFEKYAKSSSSLQLNEKIDHIEVYGINTTLIRENETEHSRSSIQIVVNIDQLLVFHFENGNKGAIGGIGSRGGTHLSFYSREHANSLFDWISYKENQFGDKMYELKHTIKF